MLKQKYFLTGIFILSAERQPIKLSWRKIVWLHYKRVKKEITDTNEAIKRGVMKGANVKRIPDFQAFQENK